MSAHISPTFYGRDVGAGAVWSKEDADYALRAIKRDRYDETFRLLERRFNDQTSFDQRVNKHCEPIEVTYKVDLVVNAGLTRLAQFMTGESTTSFTHFAAGTGTTAEGSGQTALVTEIGRVSMITSGDRYSSGTSAKFAGFFPTSTTSGTIAEGGVFDAGASGTMLFRTKYSATLVHTSGTTVFTLMETLTQSAS
ncbi:MAG: hypothetical protein QXJ74_06150 [Nitrososphaera sp.]